MGFKDAESAVACVAAMNGRWYGGRQLTVGVWDGVTNYQVREVQTIGSSPDPPPPPPRVRVYCMLALCSGGGDREGEGGET